MDNEEKLALISSIQKMKKGGVRKWTKGTYGQQFMKREAQYKGYMIALDEVLKLIQKGNL